jgi:hypothetical protein
MNYIVAAKKFFYEDFYLFQIFTSITSTIVADICTSPISAAILL